MEVIDLEEKKKPNARTLYAKLSLFLSMLMFGALLYSLFSYSDPMGMIEDPFSLGIDVKPQFLMSGILAATVATLLSFWQREKRSFAKALAVVLNIFLLILIAGPIIFAFVLDR